ncbi:MAG: SDR family NAD(P)-dependent oxidoreductase [Alphaproteobacteria bacterium]|nr:SDR family NAD(P)-dependent oxidoreductase [Alphaproteobacteria bacterium]
MSTPNEDREVVWVMGASTGLGRSLALTLAGRGRTVVASARSGDKLDRLAREADGLPGAIHAWPLDVTDSDAVARSAAEIEDQLGRVAVAVLNAGTHSPDTAADLRSDRLRSIMELNFFGVVNGLEAVLPRMIEHGGGRVAIVASLAGYRGLPSAAAYGASKAALINMAESLRPDLARYGVTLQVANPGFVRTPLTDRNEFAMPFLMDVEDAAQAFTKGLESDRFEIVFPRRFAYLMKLLRVLPYGAFFSVTRRLLPGNGDGRPPST